MEPREFWLAAHHNDPDKLIYIFDTWIDPRCSVHVIEYSAFEKLQAENERLRAELSLAKDHAEVMEHKASRLNSILNGQRNLVMCSCAGLVCKCETLKEGGDACDTSDLYLEAAKKRGW